MATGYISKGCVIPWTNGTGAAVSSGDPVQVGLKQMGIANVDIADGSSGSVSLEGVWNLAKTTGTAATQGQKLWWDTGTSKVVMAPAKNAYFLGFCHEAAASGATTVDVYLEEFACEGPRLLTLAATGTESLTAADFLSGELVLLVPNTAAKTINLPAIAGVPIGAEFLVRKTTSDAYANTLDPNSTEQINGGSTFATIDASGDVARFASNGTAWVLLDSQIA